MRRIIVIKSFIKLVEYNEYCDFISNTTFKEKNTKEIFKRFVKLSKMFEKYWFFSHCAEASLFSFICPF